MKDAGDSTNDPLVSADDPVWPGPDPLDPDLIALLKEVCKSYKTFLSSLIKYLAKLRVDGKLTDDFPGILGFWYIYLFLLGYDIGFITQAILREGLDRQLLTMKRQVFEYAVRAEYFKRHPDRAQRQYDGFPLKMREFYLKLGTPEGVEAARYILAMATSRAKDGEPPTTGDVDMYQMLRDLDPEHFAERYAKDYWLPSSIVHGHQLGMPDAIRRLNDTKFWFSHQSLMSDRQHNVMVVVDSLIKLLLITGDHFRLYGKHWEGLTESYNAIVRKTNPDAPIHDIPVDGSMIKTVASTPKPLKTTEDVDLS